MRKIRYFGILIILLILLINCYAEEIKIEYEKDLVYDDIIFLQRYPENAKFEILTNIVKKDDVIIFVSKENIPSFKQSIKDLSPFFRYNKYIKNPPKGVTIKEELPIKPTQLLSKDPKSMEKFISNPENTYIVTLNVMVPDGYGRKKLVVEPLIFPSGETANNLSVMGDPTTHRHHNGAISISNKYRKILIDQRGLIYIFQRNFITIYSLNFRITNEGKSLDFDYVDTIKFDGGYNPIIIGDKIAYQTNGKLLIHEPYIIGDKELIVHKEFSNGNLISVASIENSSKLLNYGSEGISLVDPNVTGNMLKNSGNILSIENFNIEDVIFQKDRIIMKGSKHKNKIGIYDFKDKTLYINNPIHYSAPYTRSRVSEILALPNNKLLVYDENQKIFYIYKLKLKDSLELAPTHLINDGNTLRFVEQLSGSIMNMTDDRLSFTSVGENAAFGYFINNDHPGTEHFLYKKINHKLENAEIITTDKLAFKTLTNNASYTHGFDSEAKIDVETLNRNITSRKKLDKIYGFADYYKKEINGKITIKNHILQNLINNTYLLSINEKSKGDHYFNFSGELLFSKIDPKEKYISIQKNPGGNPKNYSFKIKENVFKTKIVPDNFSLNKDEYDFLIKTITQTWYEDSFADKTQATIELNDFNIIGGTLLTCLVDTSSENIQEECLKNIFEFGKKINIEDIPRTPGKKIQFGELLIIFLDNQNPIAYFRLGSGKNLETDENIYDRGGNFELVPEINIMFKDENPPKIYSHGLFRKRNKIYFAGENNKIYSYEMSANGTEIIFEKIIEFTHKDITGVLAITVDDEENIYLTLPSAKKVLIFNKQGKFLNSINGPGGKEGEFNKPYGIAVRTEKDGFRLFVSDLNYSQRLRLIGKIHEFFIPKTTLNFNKNKTSKIYFSNSINPFYVKSIKPKSSYKPIKKIIIKGEGIKYDPRGNPSSNGSPIFGGDIPNFGDNNPMEVEKYVQLKYKFKIKDFAVDINENIYAINEIDNSILIFDPHGKILTTYELPKTYNSEIKDLTIDKDGFIYLVVGNYVIVIKPLKELEDGTHTLEYDITENNNFPNNDPIFHKIKLKNPIKITFSENTDITFLKNQNLDFFKHTEGIYKKDNNRFVFEEKNFLENEIHVLEKDGTIISFLTSKFDISIPQFYDFISLSNNDDSYSTYLSSKRTHQNKFFEINRFETNIIINDNTPYTDISATEDRIYILDTRSNVVLIYNKDGTYNDRIYQYPFNNDKTKKDDIWLKPQGLAVIERINPTIFQEFEYKQRIFPEEKPFILKFPSDPSRPPIQPILVLSDSYNNSIIGIDLYQHHLMKDLFHLITDDDHGTNYYSTERIGSYGNKEDYFNFPTIINRSIDGKKAYILDSLNNRIMIYGLQQNNRTREYLEGEINYVDKEGYILSNYEEREAREKKELKYYENFIRINKKLKLKYDQLRYFDEFNINKGYKYDLTLTGNNGGLIPYRQNNLASNINYFDYCETNNTKGEWKQLAVPSINYSWDWKEHNRITCLNHFCDLSQFTMSLLTSIYVENYAEDNSIDKPNTIVTSMNLLGDNFYPGNKEGFKEDFIEYQNKSLFNTPVWFDKEILKNLEFGEGFDGPGKYTIIAVQDTLNYKKYHITFSKEIDYKGQNILLELPFNGGLGIGKPKDYGLTFIEVKGPTLKSLFYEKFVEKDADISAKSFKKAKLTIATDKPAAAGNPTLLNVNLEDGIYNIYFNPNVTRTIRGTDPDIVFTILEELNKLDTKYISNLFKDQSKENVCVEKAYNKFKIKLNSEKLLQNIQKKHPDYGVGDFIPKLIFVPIVNPKKSKTLSKEDYHEYIELSIKKLLEVAPFVECMNERNKHRILPEVIPISITIYDYYEERVKCDNEESEKCAKKIVEFVTETESNNGDPSFLVINGIALFNLNKKEGFSFNNFPVTLYNSNTSRFREGKSIVLAHELGHQLADAADTYSSNYWNAYFQSKFPSNQWPTYSAKAVGPGASCNTTSLVDLKTCNKKYYYITASKDGTLETFAETEENYKSLMQKLLKEKYKILSLRTTDTCCGTLLDNQPGKDNLFQTGIMGNFTETKTRILSHPAAYESNVYNAFKENLKRKGYCGKVDYGYEKLGYTN